MVSRTQRNHQKEYFPVLLNSVECLNSKSLPPIEAFFNDLTGKECSLENYEQAQLAWAAAGCITFKDYMEYYLKLDVALLVDCFEQLCRTAYERSGLEAAHFFGIPGFSASVVFKYTNMQLQALPSVDMYLLFEQGIRGGMNVINNHIAESYFEEETKLYHHILYIDAMNLYGMEISMKLTKNGFRQMNFEEINQMTNEWFMNTYDPQGNKGYLI